MKKTCLLFLFCISAIFAEDDIDSTLYRWIPSLVGGFNASQIALSNWTKGGENSITWTIKGDFDIEYKAETFKFSGAIKAAFGKSKLGDDAFRTNDNEIYIDKVLSYNAGWVIDPYISNNIRTQIAVGYDFDEDPVEKISDFFDPGYITQSIGFTYDHNKKLKTRLGIAFQEVITDRFNSYSDDPDTPDEIEDFKFETGVESVTNSELKIDDNMIYKGKLRVFTRFEQLDEVDVLWDNTITAKINAWLNTNLTFTLIYEEAQSKQAQMKEALQLGVVLTIL
ncbi:MAG: DUF3078 domain-containing protein [Ignavibacteria bacterium]|jgi:hypothetical protein